MARYAEKTTVPVEKSRAEIEQVLMRYGASHFAYMMGPDKAAIGFSAKGRNLRFDLPLPDPKDRTFIYDKRGIRRSERAQLNAIDQVMRQRWRALLLCIKAKLEAVEVGISTFESEFLANIVLPNSGGETVGQWLRPQLQVAYEHGVLPPLLPAPEGH